MVGRARKKRIGLIWHLIRKGSRVVAGWLVGLFVLVGLVCFLVRRLLVFRKKKPNHFSGKLGISVGRSKKVRLC